MTTTTNTADFKNNFKKGQQSWMTTVSGNEVSYLEIKILKAGDSIVKIKHIELSGLGNEDLPTDWMVRTEREVLHMTEDSAYNEMIRLRRLKK